MHELQLSFCMLNVDNALTWRAVVHQTFIFNLFQRSLGAHTGHLWLKLMLCKLQVQRCKHDPGAPSMTVVEPKFSVDMLRESFKNDKSQYVYRADFALQLF